MRKTIFFSPIFLFLCGGIFISCHFLADISTEEKVKILFPVWPSVEMDGGRSGDVGSVDGDTRAGAVDTGVSSEDTRVDNGDTEGASFTASGDTEDTENTRVSNCDTEEGTDTATNRDATRSIAENTAGTPPGLISSPTYPPLSRWKIIVSTVQDSQTFYTTDSYLEWTFQKNQPASVTIQPITLLEDGSESEYFYPAGFVYPSDTPTAIEIENGQVQATWDQGFLSEILRRAISSKNETGVSDSRLADFLSSFNWQKAKKTINEKIEKSLENETEACFNPWQIDSSRLLDNLCYGNFKISYLNVTDCQTYLLSELFDDDFLPLSPFIPENQLLYEKGKIKIKKNTAVLIGDGHKNAFIFYCKSAKNISRDFIYMPIYRERL